MSILQVKKPRHRQVSRSPKVAEFSHGRAEVHLKYRKMQSLILLHNVVTDSLRRLSSQQSDKCYQGIPDVLGSYVCQTVCGKCTWSSSHSSPIFFASAIVQKFVTWPLKIVWYLLIHLLILYHTFNTSVPQKLQGNCVLSMHERNLIFNGMLWKSFVKPLICCLKAHLHLTC